MRRKLISYVNVLAVGLALMMSMPLSGTSQICGNVDGFEPGIVSLSDLTAMIDHLYVSNEPLSNPPDADMDGIAGVTGNDMMALIDVMYISLDPPNCEIVPDSTFPIGTDTLIFLAPPAQPGATHWTAEVWFTAQSAYASTVVPFVWSSSDPTVELDSIVIETALGGSYCKIDSVGQHGVFVYFSSFGDVFMPGHYKIATLYYSCQASAVPITLSIDTSGFPGTDHEVVVSRFTGSRPTGLKPVVISAGSSSEAVPLGGAEVEIDSSGGDTTYIVQVDTTGEQGIRFFPPGGGYTEGLRIELSNADMSVEKAELMFSFTGYLSDDFTKEEILGPVGLCGVATPLGPETRLQIVADFIPLGDTSITVQIYDNGILFITMTLYCQGLVAFAGDEITGNPWLRTMELFATSPPSFRLVLDRRVPFELCNGSTVYGDEIRFIAMHATKSVSGVYSSDVTGAFLGWFGTGYTSDVCCRGFAGNVDNDPTDVVSLGDLAALIDNLFISLDPVACMGEADLSFPRDGQTSIGDLTALIDILFISLRTPPPCP